jgi:hypothetical protein
MTDFKTEVTAEITGLKGTLAEILDRLPPKAA